MPTYITRKNLSAGVLVGKSGKDEAIDLTKDGPVVNEGVTAMVSKTTCRV